MKIDYTLYLVTDSHIVNRQELYKRVEQAILGGCTMVQLREKDISSLDFYRQALELKQITEKYRVPLIINDRVDIALAVKAAGVHIGQNDIPVSVVKDIIGRNMLLGVSVTSLNEAEQAVKDGANYLGVGAIFPTKTKKDAVLVPMGELKKIRQTIKLPIVVIGGINKENAKIFAAMGIDGLAVISAIIAQPDSREAALEIQEEFGKSKL